MINLYLIPRKTAIPSQKNSNSYYNYYFLIFCLLWCIGDALLYLLVLWRELLLVTLLFGHLLLRSSLVELQSDDIRLHYDQSDHWYTFLASDNITFKHGWRNCRILKATSHGLGKLTASLSYYSGYSESKEVIFLSSRALYLLLVYYF